MKKEGREQHSREMQRVWPRGQLLLSAEPGSISGMGSTRSYQEQGSERMRTLELKRRILTLFYQLCRWLRKGGEGRE